MRNGHLLAESPPDALMKQHSATVSKNTVLFHFSVSAYENIGRFFHVSTVAFIGKKLDFNTKQ